MSTPGPWAYDHEINRVYSMITGECVAAPHIHGNPSADAAWPADAALIAAAPELLNALEELTALVRGECPSLLDEYRGGLGRLSAQIDAALAKAKSVQP